MHLKAEVVFHSGGRRHLPVSGYRPDAVFDGFQEYWGIVFVELKATQFDTPSRATIAFTFSDSHYLDAAPHQGFRIMEGAREVGCGKVLSIETQNLL